MVSNMDVNNNTNISSLIASSISKLNLNTATRAFEQAKKAPDEAEDFKQEDIALIENNSKANILDVEDIQKYASSIGENVTIDDINYGYMYGRSVIADYSA